MSLRLPHALRILSRFALPLLAVAFAQGCVTVYQPMGSLQRPVALDPRLSTNFEKTNLLIRCIPSDDLPPGDAERVCRSVKASFEHQGAEVETEVPRNGRSARSEDMKQKIDLIVDLRSRVLEDKDSSLLRIASVFTWTLIPSVEEQTFAQDVAIRDNSGSLLASDSLQSRFVTYRGVGVWGVNLVLDYLVRDPQDELTGDVAKKDFSRDFYGQLSQLVFNAKKRSEVLHDFNTASAETPKGP